jgi:exonuclease-1
VWLHKGAFGCAEDIVKGKKTTKYVPPVGDRAERSWEKVEWADIRFVDYAMYRVRLMRHHGIEPYIVFDGGPLPAKKKTEVSREK